MKITTDGTTAGQPAQNARPREITTERFSEILNKVSKPETRPPDKASSSQPAFQVAPLLLEPRNNDDLLERLDRSLSMLESYQSRLGDPAVPVHELQPYVNRLEEEQHQLQSKLDTIPEDHPLKDLLNRSMVTMTVEVEKYRRGDFN
jgi:hypothetical protein